PADRLWRRGARAPRPGCRVTRRAVGVWSSVPHVGYAALDDTSRRSVPESKTAAEAAVFPVGERIFLLDGLFHLLERFHLDLADALGRDLELGGEVVQRELVLLAQPARLDDAAAAGVERLERPLQAARASCLGLPGLELRQ